MAQTRSESQWALVWREFRRRRLALVAGCLILVLITIGIFAPFLANDRPIAYRGYNRFEYRESLRTLGAVMNRIGREPVDERGETLATIDRQFKAMSSAVVPETAARLDEVHQELIDLAEADASTVQASQWNALRTRLRREFDARNVEFAGGWRWPVLASLNGADVGFLVWNVLLLSLLLWRWGLKFITPHPAARNAATLGVFAGVPLLCGLLTWWLVPERLDRTNYKAGVLAADVEDQARAPVVYEAVVWPAIPYGLDENDLVAKHTKPPWWDAARQVFSLGGAAKQPASESKTTAAGPWDMPHWLGTDGIGRDILSRMIWGSRVSLAVGIVAVSIYVTIGIIVGAVAGYFRGAADLIISRLIEIVICFPSFFLILTIVAFVGPSIFNIMIVIGLIGWTGVARLVRGEFLRLSEQEFVLAGRALGYSPARIIFRHVLPNAMAPVLVSATFGIAGAILTESALSFLGFGITVPKPSWGGILAEGRDAIFRAPWLIMLPGFAIFLTITAYNLVGEALRDAADPRLRGQLRA